MRSVFVVVLTVAIAACAPSEEPDRQLDRRRTITTDAAPAAIGPYSQAVQVGRTLYLAGQIGLDPEANALVEGGVEAETEQAMRNLQVVLEAAGFAMTDVVDAQVFLADLDEYDAMNTVYGSFFEGSPPARAAVEVARLPRDARVEIKLVAAK